VPPKIIVVAPDPRWAASGEAECVRLRGAAGDLFVDLEHIGSTSVPNLAAKPVIDLLGSIASTDSVEALARRLETLGYEHRPRSMTDVDVAYLRRIVDGVRSHHLHVIRADQWADDQRRIFRDALRAQPDVAAAYAALKRELAVLYADDRMGYTLAKSDFVEGVVARYKATG
jgi:GrpB-like predicted nucleotidyltransferase (UPF0157 family)